MRRAIQNCLVESLAGRGKFVKQKSRPLEQRAGFFVVSDVTQVTTYSTRPADR